MKIVIDDKIPYIREAISRITADAVYKKGTEISAEDVRDADALIVRTRTRCDEALLKGSSVKFVATATIGFDHIDAGYMRRAGIEWMSCPGCNAASVAQYVRSVLLLLKRQKGMSLESSTIGIVGCGHVGSKVKEVAEEYGMRVLVKGQSDDNARQHHQLHHQPFRRMCEGSAPEGVVRQYRYQYYERNVYIASQYFPPIPVIPSAVSRVLSFL